MGATQNVTFILKHWGNTPLIRFCNSNETKIYKSIFIGLKPVHKLVMLVVSKKGKTLLVIACFIVNTSFSKFLLKIWYSWSFKADLSLKQAFKKPIWDKLLCSRKTLTQHIWIWLHLLNSNIKQEEFGTSVSGWSKQNYGPHFVPTFFPTTGWVTGSPLVLGEGIWFPSTRALRVGMIPSIQTSLKWWFVVLNSEISHSFTAITLCIFPLWRFEVY